MKKGKRLLITLLATLTMVVGAFSVAYAATYYDVQHESGHTGASVTASDGQLTVNCNYSYISGDTHRCEFYRGATVMITPAENLTYNGQQKPVTVSPLPTGITKVSLYYKGTQADGTNYERSSAAPKNAGTYTASLTLNVDGEGEQIITKTFTIEPKEVDIYWQRSSAGGNVFEYTYNGQEQVPYAAVYSSSLIEPDSCSVNVTGGQTDVGEYTATAESLSNPNYKLPADNTQPFEITVKYLSITWDTATGAITPAPYSDGPSYYYTGEAQAPEISSVTGIVEGDDCEVEVDENTKGIDVDYYFARGKLSGSDSGNYALYTHNSQKFYIVKKVVEPRWDHDTKLIYNGKLQYPAVELAYADGSPITDEDKARVKVKVYTDYECTEEVTGKTVVGTQYYAKAILTDNNDFDFDPNHEEYQVEAFIIYAKPVSVTLTSEDPITYDAQWHKPEVKIEGVEDGDDCVPVESLKGKTKITMVDPETGAKTNNIDIADVNVDDEPGVYHASVDKYTAKVENKNEVEPEAEGYDVTKSGLKGDDARNYVLEKDVTCKFAILPLEITLDWFRPAYDEYGDEVEGADPVLVDVANGEKLKLVFNGKKQVPTAKIKSELLLTNPETNEPDVCKITVRAPKEAVEARTAPYTAEDISFSNPDYTRDKNGIDYYIIARPVKLEWSADETTYNGKEQKQTVEITNIQKTDRGNNYSADEGIGVVKVSKITYTPGYHFGTEGKDTDEAESTIEGWTGYYDDNGDKELGLAEGTEIVDNARIPVDAGTYVMTAAELSDPHNYSLVKLNTEDPVIEPAVIHCDDIEQPAYVALHHPIYTIHQYEITKIDWRNTKVTYNASNQKPIAEVNKSDLKGPDTNKEVAVMIHADKNSAKDDFVGKCNAKTYDIYVLKNKDLRGIKGARCMNYFIGETAKKMQEKFTINKKALTVTVYNKTGYYGDNPASYKHTVKYTGLVNGKVNKDDNHQNKNIPGKYTPEGGSEKDVVEGTLKYTTNYAKWGKPGTYKIKASGLKSDNYAIKYVDGKLTIKNRFLTGDLVAKAIAGNKKGTISWRPVKDAAKYKLYFSLCNSNGKTYTPKYYKTFGAKTTSFVMKNLESHTYYKFYIEALDKSGKVIAKTPQHHFCTNNSFGEYTNPKKVTPSKKAVTLKKGKTYKLSAKVSKVISYKKLTNGDHTKKLRYKSGNKNVATVSANGTIKGVGTGWCRIYVMGANGIWSVVEVTVK